MEETGRRAAADVVAGEEEQVARNGEAERDEERAGRTEELVSVEVLGFGHGGEEGVVFCNKCETRETKTRRCQEEIYLT